MTVPFLEGVTLGPLKPSPPPLVISPALPEVVVNNPPSIMSRINVFKLGTCESDKFRISRKFGPYPNRSNTDLKYKTRCQSRVVQSRRLFFFSLSSTMLNFEHGGGGETVLPTGEDGETRETGVGNAAGASVPPVRENG